MRLKDKVAIVTGAASGIGRATAALFGQEGATVMCADMDGEGAERRRGRSRTAAARRPPSRRTCGRGGRPGLVRTTVERWGRVDIMFNNAGIEFGLPVTQVPEEEWDRLIDMNLKGVFLGCKYAIPEMAEAGRRLHRQHGLGRGAARLRLPLHLLRLQGRRGADDEVAGGGVGVAERPGKRRLSGGHPHADGGPRDRSRAG